MAPKDEDPRSRLAYDESIRALNLQSAALDDLRSRTGILLTAISLTATFLGSKALTDGFTLWTDLGLAFFLLSGLLCLRVLWPTDSWSFAFNASNIVKGYLSEDDPASLDEMHVEFAEINQDNWEKNRDMLRPMFESFRLAVLALIAQLPCWLIAISQIHA